MSVIRDQDLSPGAPTGPAARSTSGFRRAALRWTGRIGLGLFGVAVAWFAIGFVAFARSIAVQEPREVLRADGIVVLTGGSQRLNDGLALLADGYGRRLLLSGVYQKSNREEISRYADDRRAMLDCCVDLGKGAQNTIGNAIEARRWARSNGFGSLLVVTSNYHMARTLAEFSHAMGNIRVIGYPVVSDSVDVTRVWTDPAAFRLVISEYAKLVVSEIRRVFETDPEHSRLPILVGRQKPLGPQAIERPGAP